MSEEKELGTYNISLKKAWALSKSWKRAAIIWRTLDHIFSIGSFAASVAVIFVSGISKNDDNTSVINLAIIFFSSLAALLTLTGFACNPTKYMTNYRMAFQLLNQSLVENTDDNGEVVGESGFVVIRKAIIKGEEYIGKTFDVETGITVEDLTRIPDNNGQEANDRE